MFFNRKPRRPALKSGPNYWIETEEQAAERRAGQRITHQAPPIEADAFAQWEREMLQEEDLESDGPPASLLTAIMNVGDCVNGRCSCPNRNDFWHTS